MIWRNTQWGIQMFNIETIFYNIEKEIEKNSCISLHEELKIDYMLKEIYGIVRDIIESEKYVWK